MEASILGKSANTPFRGVGVLADFAQETLLNRPSLGYCPGRFFNHTFRRVLLRTSSKRTLSHGFWTQALKALFKQHPLDKICANFPKGDKWEPKFTGRYYYYLAWQAFFALLDTLRGFCAILRPLRGTLREVGWRPPGRRGVGGRKPPPFSSRCSNTQDDQGSADFG